MVYLEGRALDQYLSFCLFCNANLVQDQCPLPVPYFGLSDSESRLLVPRYEAVKVETQQIEICLQIYLRI